MVDQLQEAAAAIFLSILKSSAEHGGKFRLIMISKIGGTEKPLLIVGNAHSQIEDGHLIAVLNPAASLASSDQLIAGAAYPTGLLKEIVSGKCDAMVELWIDAYKKNGVSKICSYTCRTPKAPQFEVR